MIIQTKKTHECGARCCEKGNSILAVPSSSFAETALPLLYTGIALLILVNVYHWYHSTALICTQHFAECCPVY